MGSRKGSAKAKQRAAFDAHLTQEHLAGGLDSLFAQERSRKEQDALAREEAREEKACLSKNRYRSRAEAEEAIALCAEHGTHGLRCYRCDYCKGWHLTSHFHCDQAAGRPD